MKETVKQNIEIFGRTMEQSRAKRGEREVAADVRTRAEGMVTFGADLAFMRRDGSQSPRDFERIMHGGRRT